MARLDERFPALAPRLLAICRSLAGDLAEDVVQETYIQGRKRLDQLRDLDAMEPWLTTIAVRQCIRHHRGRRRLLDFLPHFGRATVLLERTAELQVRPAFAYAAPLAGVLWLALAVRVFNSQIRNYQSAGH